MAGSRVIYSALGRVTPHTASRDSRSCDVEPPTPPARERPGLTPLGRFLASPPLKD
jgi:hypothetical protein